jgi:hypothetical protein
MPRTGRGRVRCDTPFIRADNRTLDLGYRGGAWWYRCVACGGAGYARQDECFEQAVIHGRQECQR